MSDSINDRLIPVNLTDVRLDHNRDQSQRILARQVASQDSFIDSSENVTFNPWAADRLRKEKFQTLGDRSQTAQAQETQRTSLFKLESVLDSAKRYQKHNPELGARSLMALYNAIRKGDPYGVILKQVQTFFPDVTLADEALDFLAEVSVGELQASIRLAKEEHNKKNSRRIVAGRNIAEQAKQFSDKGLGTPTSLRDLYREITHNPREPLDLFEEFAEKYPFEQLSTVLQFFFRSVGSDLNAKGSSMPRGELFQLLNEVRILQAILGIYHYFKARMNLLSSYFGRHAIPLPNLLNFENLAKQYVRLAMDRYPNASKIRKISAQYTPEDLDAQILILMQMRDATRGLSPRLYKSDKQKHDLHQAILDALDELEDLLEEGTEEGEDEEDEGNQKPQQKE